MFTLRTYQKECIAKIINFLRKDLKPAVVELATGAGKSIIIAEVAKDIQKRTHKKILVLAPSAELVKQNYAKYKTTNNEASICSASIDKSLEHQVIFATPKTFKNSLKELNGEVALIIIDEAHKNINIAKSIKKILEKDNANIRVLGLTATPYTLQTGYIYQCDENGKEVSDDLYNRSKPFYHQLIYKVGAQQLINEGYLTPLTIGEIGTGFYNLEGLKTTTKEDFSDKEIWKVISKQHRLTADIVKDIIIQCQDKKGVMIFATTVDHGKEIMQSLPADNSFFIGGDVNMDKKTRNKLVDDFKNQKYKYLVNVATMTTGVDFTHCDCIAILRPTQSIALFQQIIGRGLRLHDGKKECLLLDYAQNLGRVTKNDNPFELKPKSFSASGGGFTMEAKCPACKNYNNFVARKRDSETIDYKVDEYGYYTHSDGSPVITRFETRYPAHLGRNCTNENCEYKWSYRECEICGMENDIVARKCTGCRNELIDPNKKLVLKRQQKEDDLGKKRTEKVLSYTITEAWLKGSRKKIDLNITTPTRTFTVFWFDEPQSAPEFFYKKYYLDLITQGFEKVRYNKVKGLWKLHNKV